MSMLGLLTVLQLLGQLDDTHWTKVGGGVASLYRPWRKSRTVPYARYAGNWRVRPTPEDLVCAHRRLPFWTILRLSHGKRRAFCVVLDRGPFGCCTRNSNGATSHGCRHGHVYSVSTKGCKGYRRGVLDATPLVHKMLGSSGWSYVIVEKLVGDVAKAVRAKPRRVLRLNVVRRNSPRSQDSTLIPVNSITR
jgi:hypothetical protein